MCASRKPAVKDARRSTAARAPETEAKAIKPAPAKPPAAPKAQEKAPNRFQKTWTRIGDIIRDTRSEIKKVTWPDRETTRKLTLLVLGVSVVLGLALGGIDYFLLRLFEAI